MSSQWQITERSASGAAATASIAAAGSASAGGQVNRLLALAASISGTTAGTAELVVRDGATGSGTIIWQVDLNEASSSVVASDLDLRASVGNALTIEFTAGVAGDTQCVNAQGDYVPIGWPYGRISS